MGESKETCNTKWNVIIAIRGLISFVFVIIFAVSAISCHRISSHFRTLNSNDKIMIVCLKYWSCNWSRVEWGGLLHTMCESTSAHTSHAYKNFVAYRLLHRVWIAAVTIYLYTTTGLYHPFQDFQHFHVHTCTPNVVGKVVISVFAAFTASISIFVPKEMKEIIAMSKDRNRSEKQHNEEKCSQWRCRPEKSEFKFTDFYYHINSKSLDCWLSCQLYLFSFVVVFTWMEYTIIMRQLIARFLLYSILKCNVLSMCRTFIDLSSQHLEQHTKVVHAKSIFKIGRSMDWLHCN